MPRTGDGGTTAKPKLRKPRTPKPAGPAARRVDPRVERETSVRRPAPAPRAPRPSDPKPARRTEPTGGKARPTRTTARKPTMRASTQRAEPTRQKPAARDPKPTEGKARPRKPQVLPGPLPIVRARSQASRDRLLDGPKKVKRVQVAPLRNPDGDLVTRGFTKPKSGPSKEIVAKHSRTLKFASRQEHDAFVERSKGKKLVKTRRIERAAMSGDGLDRKQRNTIARTVKKSGEGARNADRQAIRASGFTVSAAVKTEQRLTDQERRRNAEKKRQAEATKKAIKKQNEKAKGAADRARAAQAEIAKADADALKGKTTPAKDKRTNADKSDKPRQRIGKGFHERDKERGRNIADNAVNDVEDLVRGLPQSVVETAKAARSALDIVDKKVTTGAEKDERGQKPKDQAAKDYARGLKESFTGKFVAGAVNTFQGDGKEARKDFKDAGKAFYERPVSGLLEVGGAGAVVGRGASAAAATGRNVKRAKGWKKVSPKAVAQQAREDRIRPELRVAAAGSTPRVQNKPDLVKERKRAQDERTGRKAREDRGDTEIVDRRDRNYSPNLAVRAAQKGLENRRAKAGEDVTALTGTRKKKARDRRFDAERRNAEVAGAADELRINNQAKGNRATKTGRARRRVNADRAKRLTADLLAANYLRADNAEADLDALIKRRRELDGDNSSGAARLEALKPRIKQLVADQDVRNAADADRNASRRVELRLVAANFFDSAEDTRRTGNTQGPVARGEAGIATKSEKGEVDPTTGQPEPKPPKPNKPKTPSSAAKSNVSRSKLKQRVARDQASRELVDVQAALSAMEASGRADSPEYEKLLEKSQALTASALKGTRQPARTEAPESASAPDQEPTFTPEEPEGVSPPPPSRGTAHRPSQERRKLIRDRARQRRLEAELENPNLSQKQIKSLQGRIDKMARRTNDPKVRARVAREEKILKVKAEVRAQLLREKPELRGISTSPHGRKRTGFEQRNGGGHTEAATSQAERLDAALERWARAHLAGKGGEKVKAEKALREVIKGLEQAAAALRDKRDANADPQFEASKERRENAQTVVSSGVRAPKRTERADGPNLGPVATEAADAAIERHTRSRDNLSKANHEVAETQAVVNKLKRQKRAIKAAIKQGKTHDKNGVPYKEKLKSVQGQLASNSKLLDARRKAAKAYATREQADRAGADRAMPEDVATARQDAQRAADNRAPGGDRPTFRPTDRPMPAPKRGEGSLTGSRHYGRGDRRTKDSTVQRGIHTQAGFSKELPELEADLSAAQEALAKAQGPYQRAVAKVRLKEASDALAAGLHRRTKPEPDAPIVTGARPANANPNNARAVAEAQRGRLQGAAHQADLTEAAKREAYERLLKRNGGDQFHPEVVQAREALEAAEAKADQAHDAYEKALKQPLPGVGTGAPKPAGVITPTPRQAPETREHDDDLDEALEPGEEGVSLGLLEDTPDAVPESIPPVKVKEVLTQDLSVAALDQRIKRLEADLRRTEDIAESSAFDDEIAEAEAHAEHLRRQIRAGKAIADRKLAEADTARGEEPYKERQRNRKPRTTSRSGQPRTVMIPKKQWLFDFDAMGKSPLEKVNAIGELLTDERRGSLSDTEVEQLKLVQTIQQAKHDRTLPPLAGGAPSISVQRGFAYWREDGEWVAPVQNSDFPDGQTSAWISGNKLPGRHMDVAELREQGRGFREENIVGVDYDLSTTETGSLALDQAMNNARVATLQELLQATVSTFGHKHNGQQVFTTPEAAKAAWQSIPAREQNQWEPVVIKKGRPTGPKVKGKRQARTPDEVVFLPKSVHVRLGQGINAFHNRGALGRSADIVERMFIRAVLPFSGAWFAGNVADMAMRGLLTQRPDDLARGRAFTKQLYAALEAEKPGLGDKVLGPLVGHLESRKTMRKVTLADVADSTEWQGLKTATLKLHELGKVGGLRQLRHGTEVTIDGLFNMASSLERRFTHTNAGAVGQAYARALGLDVADASNLATRLGSELARDPDALVAFQRRVLEVNGDFITRSPDTSNMVNAIPFYRWIKEANKFVFKTLPVQHPLRAAMLVLSVQATEEQRAAMGLNFRLTKDDIEALGVMDTRSGFEATKVVLGDHAVSVAPFTSFGEAARWWRIADGAKQGEAAGNRQIAQATVGEVVPWATRPAIEAARTAADGEGTAKTVTAAAMTAAKSFVPGGTNAMNVYEDRTVGHQSKPYSRPGDPQVWFPYGKNKKPPKPGLNKAGLKLAQGALRLDAGDKDFEGFEGKKRAEKKKKRKKGTPYTAEERKANAEAMRRELGW